MTQPLHTPVLLKETCDFLVTRPDGAYFDATLGFGGHTAEILTRLNTHGTVAGTDVDETAFEFSRKRFDGDPRCKLYRFNFTKIGLIAKLESIRGFDGILADLGISSYQLDDKEAGISIKENARLDLRLDKTLPLTAAEILNTFEEETLVKIFFEYGEEKNARKISKMICETREAGRFVNASDLEKTIARIVPAHFVHKTMRRLFQALRIHINDELGALKEFLASALSHLSPKGRLAVISYHSLEDRIVKQFMKYEATNCICPPSYPVCSCNKRAALKILTGKAVVPSGTELAFNKRARSAKLRVAEKI